MIELSLVLEDSDKEFQMHGFFKKGEDLHVFITFKSWYFYLKKPWKLFLFLEMCWLIKLSDIGYSHILVEWWHQKIKTIFEKIFIIVYHRPVNTKFLLCKSTLSKGWIIKRSYYPHVNIVSFSPIKSSIEWAPEKELIHWYQVPINSQRVFCLLLIKLPMASKLSEVWLTEPKLTKLLWKKETLFPTHSQLLHFTLDNN